MSLLVADKISHPLCVWSKDCNIISEAICLTITLLVTRVVGGGGWKMSLLLSIQIRELRQCEHGRDKYECVKCLGRAFLIPKK